MADNEATKTPSPESEQATKETALHYIEALVDTAREPFLILDNKLKVRKASAVFYTDFKVNPKETEGQFVYDLGNKQWDIPALRKLLEEVLPQKKTITDFEVVHEFESIGQKIMMLNAKQIDSAQLIILAIEDVTEKRLKEEQSRKHTKGLQDEVNKQTKQLATRVAELEKMNRAMVDRELKMVELKKELEKMKKENETK
ncbi:MAG: hypothetical protein ABI643_03740 [Candidatus Doudnabacteria bacterium]